MRRRRIRDILEQRPRARDETAALHTDIGHGPVELHHGATDALVTHEHIRAVAEDDKWQLILVNEAQYLLQLRHRGRKNEKIRRPADFKRRMQTHRLVEQELLRLQKLPASGNKGFSLQSKMLCVK